MGEGVTQDDLVHVFGEKEPDPAKVALELKDAEFNKPSEKYNDLRDYIARKVQRSEIVNPDVTNFPDAKQKLLQELQESYPFLKDMETKDVVDVLKNGDESGMFKAIDANNPPEQADMYKQQLYIAAAIMAENDDSLNLSPEKMVELQNQVASGYTKIGSGQSMRNEQERLQQALASDIELQKLIYQFEATRDVISQGEWNQQQDIRDAIGQRVLDITSQVYGVPSSESILFQHDKTSTEALGNTYGLSTSTPLAANEDVHTLFQRPETDSLKTRDAELRDFIDTAIHESVHHVDEQKAQAIVAGTLKPSDPSFNQGAAYLYNLASYSTPGETQAEYSAQAIEQRADTISKGVVDHVIKAADPEYAPPVQNSNPDIKIEGSLTVLSNSNASLARAVAPDSIEEVISQTTELTTQQPTLPLPRQTPTTSLGMT